MDEFGSGLRAHLGFEPEEPLELVPAPAPGPEPEPVRSPAEEELERRLEYLAAAEAALLEREQRLAEHEQAVAEAAEKERLVAPAPGAPVADVLRQRAEEHADLLWRTFEDALSAEDIELRLTAARTLIAAAYPAGIAPRTDTVEAVEDELARLRERRVGR
jgi:hypothetical protein